MKRVVLKSCFLLIMTPFVVHRETESQLSSDTDFEDPDGRSAKTGKGLVCFSNLPSFIIHICPQGSLSQSQHAIYHIYMVAIFL